MSWQGHVRNTLFHFCQLPPVKRVYYVAPMVTRPFSSVIGMSPIGGFRLVSGSNVAASYFLKENPCCTWITRFPLVQASTVKKVEVRHFSLCIQCLTFNSMSIGVFLTLEQDGQKSGGAMHPPSLKSGGHCPPPPPLPPPMIFTHFFHQFHHHPENSW